MGRFRKDFSKIARVIDIPNLIDIQNRSFDRFLQADVSPEKREDVGLQAVFKSVFPIRDFNETASLEFVCYVLEKPKYDVEECLQRGMTYAAPIKVTIRLIVWDNADKDTHNIRDVKEQDVYFGEIPVMTENGTFIINGTERVIVSQLHRSPGIFFDTTQSTAVSAQGKKLYSCRIIPYRGSWLDIEFDHKDLIQVRIDRRRKLHATVLLKALDYSPEDLLRYFYPPEKIKIDPRSRVLVITDLVVKVDEIERLVAEIDIPVEQVSIEAILVDVVLSDDAQTGIDWVVDLVRRVNRSGDVVGTLTEVQANSAIDTGSIAQGVVRGINLGGEISFGILSSDFDIRAAIAGEVSSQRAKVIANPVIVTSVDPGRNVVGRSDVCRDAAGGTDATYERLPPDRSRLVEGSMGNAGRAAERRNGMTTSGNGTQTAGDELR